MTISPVKDSGTNTKCMAAIQQSTSQEKGRSGSGRGLHIDMTPMVDLAFLLLTFFIMTSVLTKPFVVKLEMPQEEGDPPPVKAERVLNIILAENDQIYWYVADKSRLERTSFSAGGVRKLLLQKNAQIQKMYVLIKPSVGSKYRNVIDILDEMTITQIQRYALVKIDDLDKQLIAEAGLNPQ